MSENPFHPSAISKETAEFVAKLEAELAETPAVHEVPIELARQARDQGVGVFPFHPPLPEAQDIDIPAAPGGPGRVRVLRPKGDATGVFLHIHGGGWSLGRPWHQDHRLKSLIERTGCATVSVEYRLGPEHPWPACIKDCAAAARWLLDNMAREFGTDRVVIGGESAGAHLAATTLLSMKSIGRLGWFSGALLAYGCYDLAMTPSVQNWGARKLILSTPTIAFFTANLGIPPDQLRDPLVSPLYGDLTDMPPALFQCGTLDPLVDDTAFMAARWTSSGGDARTIWYPGGPHAFDYFDTDLSQQAQDDAVAFLSERFSG